MIKKNKTISSSNASSSLFSKILALVLFLAVTLMIIFIFSYFVWNRWQSKEIVVNYLPSESTVAFLELDLRQDQLEKKQFTALLPVSNIQNLLPKFPELQKWLGNRVALAYLSENEPGWIVMAEVADQEAFSTYLQSLLLGFNTDSLIQESYRGFDLMRITAGQNFSILKIGNLVFFSDQTELLKTVANTYLQPEKSLLHHQPYRQIVNALPNGNFGFLYWDNFKLNNQLRKLHQIYGLDLAKLRLYQPYFDLFAQDGIAISGINNQLQLFQLSTLRPPFQSKSLLKFNQPFMGKFTELANDHQGNLLITGVDLKSQIEQWNSFFTTEIWQSTGGISAYFTQEFQAVTGLKIDLNQENMAALSGEYALLLKNEGNNWSWLLALETKNKAQSTATIQNLINQNLNQFAKLAPISRPLILPDGSQGSELVSDPSSLKVTENSLQTADGKKLLAWLYEGDYLLISNSSAQLAKSSTTLQKTVKNSYLQSFPNFGPVDEMAKIQIDQSLKNWISQSQIAFLSPLFDYPESLIYGRRYTDNGIMSVYTLTLKQANGQN